MTPTPDSCPNGDFSGSFYDGKCTLSTNTGSGVTSSGTTNPTTPTTPSNNIVGLSVGTIGERYFATLDDARKYL